MRLATLADGRAVRVEGDALLPLPGRLADHLCRPPAEPTGATIDASTATLAPPIARPGKLACIGLNYRDHAAEAGQEIPSKPLLFAKFSSCVIGPGVPIEIPSGSTKVDYEAELAVVIGRPAYNVSESEALNFVGGYACFNDVSERDIQKEDGQWLRAKSFNTFGPFGPYVMTPDEVPDPNDLSIRCRVNGDAVQDSSTAQMIHRVPALVSFCSRAFPLEPGDIIATGTPAGVGLGSGVFLEPGDTVEVEIQGLGVLANPVV
ncbi:MAG: fumarylacetoacetate hydrolase family protein [Actinobacteria bacterium]|nr:fumarylacetoacetate hydrolase family protein [Actinomycetota bacterium]